MTELNDQSLLTHWYRHRNAEAFRVLATRHARMVYATALRILRNAHDAEEVAQQSFLALAQTRRPPSGNVAAWLHRTAYRAALNLTRARTRRTARDHAYATAQPDSTRTEWDDIRDLVDEAVAGLPDACRECIVLYFFEEQTHAAIGERLGITRQAVAQRIEKGITLVRKRLASKGIVAPAGAALVALIHENSALALPATLTMELGRIALAGTPSLWAVGATFVSGFGLKVAAATMVVAAGVVAGIATYANEREADADSARSAETKAVDTSESNRQPAATIPAPSVVPTVETAEPMVATVESNTQSVELASVSGRVVLPDGTPYAHATVRIEAAGYEGVARPKGTSFSVAADELGRFEQLEILPAEYMVIASEPNTERYDRRSATNVTLAAGEHKSGLEIRFGTEGDLTISGTVVGTAGNPLEGIQVATVGSVVRTAVSDEDGEFTLSYLPDEQFTVLAPGIERNQAVTVVKAGDQDVRLVVALDGKIQGRAIDAKTRKPIASFQATCMQGNLAGFEPSLAFWWHSFSESDGAFELPRVPAGDVTVAIRAKGYEIAVAPVVVEEGKTVRNLEVAMEPARAITLAGSVVNEGGQPVEGARIYTYPIPSYDSAGDATSDAQGRFEVTNALPGITELYASHPGFASAVAAASEDTTIVMARAGRVNVEVYSDGAPMPKAGARVRSEGGGYNEGKRVDDTGRATFEKVPGGELRIEVRPDNVRFQSTSVVLAPGEEKVVRVDIAPAEASVEGTVYLDGEPVSSAEVRLFVETATGSETLSQRVTASGEYRFAQVPVGKAQLGVVTSPPQRRALVDEVALTAGQVTTVDVDVTEAAQVRGTVNGVAADEVVQMVLYRGTIELAEALEIGVGRPVDPVVAAHATIDESGAFEAPLQKPGTYTVVLFTNPEGDYLSRVDRDYRVVEVPESGELNLDFNLTP